MDIYLYGTGTFGKKAYGLLKKYNDVCVKGFIDTYCTEKVIQGISVYHIEDIKKDAIIVICIAGLTEVYEMLKERRYTNVYAFTAIKNDKTGKFLKDYCVNCNIWNGNVLPYAEIHIVDFCNLNCKGCTHFSPLFEKKLPDTEQRKNDIKLLSSKFTNIFRFRLLGGEPFLNPDIGEYVEYTRECMPNTVISIVTNGILIPKLDKKIFEIIRKNNISIIISGYEPTMKMIEKIKYTLEKEDIIYEINKVEKFNKPLVIRSDMPLPKLCISKTCVNIYNGKIGRCPTLMYIDILNSRFATEFPNEGIMALDGQLTSDEIMNNLRKKVPLCDYCVKNDMEWSMCGVNPELNDFVETE